ncbi:MAG: hypothetical protein JO053_08805 [Acidobacteria bacterium]|nr:hypothetical protein [Acidobacteriota bacterium]
MSIIPKLATSLNRRDEVPNQELAAAILKSRDQSAVDELVDNLPNKNKRIRHDCIKVLYEIGCVEPKMIAGHLAVFVTLLTSRDNRLQWGSMTAIGCIAKVKSEQVFAVLPQIIAAADSGSVITRDHCVNILIELLGYPKYSREAFAQLFKQLATCPTNQLPMYAERSEASIEASHRRKFGEVLSSRISEIERESGRKRVQKVMKKLSR